MLKKLSLFLGLCLLSVAHADQLHNAIYSNDVCLVSDILSHVTLTQEQLNKYLDFADYVVTIRHDNLSYRILEADRRWSFDAASLGVGTAILVYQSIKEESFSLWFCAKAGFLSGIGAGLGISIIGCLKERSRKAKYLNALHIKELLQHYQVPVVNEQQEN